MKRLVYAPHIQAFIKADDGVVDISPYIVRGSINRKVNQVSSAQLTLRNPVQGSSSRLLFTEYQANGQQQPHPMFHPMDPIIIVMQRLQGHPVQVFTGYVDKAPYLQLYPGLCTIEASCTLKRLLYTQWDASLPAVQNFLVHFGWVPNGSGIWNLSADTATVTGSGGKITKGQFTDGSIGALLFAVLNIIGDWDESTIWIEALPPQIKEIVVKLYNQINTEVQQSANSFESLLQQILGSSSQGGGSPTGGGTGGGTVNSPLLNANQNGFGSALSQATGLDPNVVAAWILSEEPQSASHAPNGTNNWLNIGAYDAGNWATGGDPNWATPSVAGTHTADFLAGRWGGPSSGIKAILNTVNQSPQAQIAAIQNSGWATSHYPGLPSTYSSIVHAGGQKTLTSSLSAANAPNAGLSPVQQAAANIGAAKTQVPGTSPGGKQGNPNAAGNSSAAANLAAVAAVAQQAVQRQAQSHCFHYEQLRPINYDLTSGTVYIDCSGFAIACYKAAGLPDPSGNNYNGSGNSGEIYANSTKVDASNALPGDLCLFGPQGSVHINVYIGNGQSASMGSEGEPKIGPAASMGPSGFVGIFRSNTAGQPATAGGAGATTAGTGGGTGAAAAFAAMLELPSVFSMADAVLFTGKRSFIADQPLFPFITQLAAASMRNFMSMPNGNFFAFFPDYFGFFGRKYYWEIRDIEIIDGRIDLSDDPLLTHMAVAGDVTTYSGEVTTTDLLLTAGIFDIFDALTTGYVGMGETTLPGFNQDTPAYGVINPNPVETERTKEAAVAFLQRYGARPYVEEVPAIRSPFYELFLSFQNFMIAWSKQFQTTFELTFMPELFPGGLIALPDHGLQCYVEEVVHNFDYEQGFTTTVSLSSPSRLSSNPRTNITAGLARPAALTSLQKAATTLSKGKSQQLQHRS